MCRMSALLDRGDGGSVTDLLYLIEGTTDVSHLCFVRQRTRRMCHTPALCEKGKRWRMCHKPALFDGGNAVCVTCLLCLIKEMADVSHVCFCLIEETADVSHVCFP